MECQVHSQVWLHSLAAVGMCFISLFGLAEVHSKNNISKVNMMPGTQVLEDEQEQCWCSRGRQADGSSAAHQHPPFVLVCAGHICYTPKEQHMVLPSLFYVCLKVWGILSSLYCVVSPTLTFATQLACVHSHRRQLGAESQVPSSHGQLGAAIKPGVYLCGSEIISLNLPYLTVITDPMTNVAQVQLYKQSYK